LEEGQVEKYRVFVELTGGKSAASLALRWVKQAQNHQCQGAPYYSSGTIGLLHIFGRDALKNKRIITITLLVAFFLLIFIISSILSYKAGWNLLKAIKTT
jgi:hypothetical protein